MRIKEELKLENRETLHLKVSNVLRNAIIHGNLESGKRLIQSELANSLGVSEMPVREALRKLESEGFIKIEPHRGAIVKSFTKRDIKEIYLLRSYLEKMAVEHGGYNLKQEEINLLEKYVSQMKVTNNVNEFIEINIKLHRLLIKNCTWGRLLIFIETLWSGLPQQTPHLLEGQMEISNLEHQDILNALKDNNGRKAAKILFDHITRTGDNLISCRYE
jgi:DNA-binding GntR family transcriptional regulator